MTPNIPPLKRPPPIGGTARLESVLLDTDGKTILARQTTEFPSLIRNVPSLRTPTLPLPSLGPAGKILITIPTVGHNKFASIIAAASSWALAIGTGTTPEASTDTALVAEITTGGGARVNIVPTYLSNVITFAAAWTFTAPFTATEVALFNANILMMRNVYATSMAVSSGQTLISTLTDTV